MNRLREARKQKNMGLRETAKVLDISGAHLSDIEIGNRHPSEDLRKKIEALFGDVGLLYAKAEHLLRTYFPHLSDEETRAIATLIDVAERRGQ